MLRKSTLAGTPSRRALRSHRLNLEVLLRETADGVFAVDAKGRIALWNRSAEHIVGYTAREVVGRLCCHVFLGTDRLGTPLCYNGCHIVTLDDRSSSSRSSSSRRLGLTIRTKAGTPVRLVIDALLIPDARGERPVIVHLFRERAPRDLDRVPATDDDRLTPRELEVLRLIAGGANTKLIAIQLRVSPATVRNHVQNLLGKLGVHSRLEAVAYAVRHRVFAGLGPATSRTGLG